MLYAYLQGKRPKKKKKFHTTSLQTGSSHRFSSKFDLHLPEFCLFPPPKKHSGNKATLHCIRPRVRPTALEICNHHGTSCGRDSTLTFTRVLHGHGCAKEGKQVCIWEILGKRHSDYMFQTCCCTNRVDKSHHSTVSAAGSWLNVAMRGAWAYKKSVPRTGSLSSVHNYLIVIQSPVTELGLEKLNDWGSYRCINSCHHSVTNSNLHFSAVILVKLLFNNQHGYSHGSLPRSAVKHNRSE